MLNIYLIRHGETAWNADNNRYTGRTDLPLTEKGLQQAEALKQQLSNVTLDAVYASPLQRAYTTAKIATGKEPIKDDRLIEIDWGTWEGKSKDNFYAEDPSLWDNWMADPAHARAGGTGENGSDVVQRIDDFFISFFQRHTSGNYLVAAHNGVNRFFLAHKLGMPLKNYRMFFQENSALTMFTIEPDGSFVLKYLNSRW
jgi:broad specificity phosphatase PhoE